MKKIFLNFFVILSMLTFGSVCIDAPEASSQKPDASASLKTSRLELVTFAAKYQDMALACEKSDQLQKALYLWKIVGSLNPEDKKTNKKIAKLKIKIKKKAKKHFNQGVSAYKRNSMKKAKKEFLITLRYNPRHIAAMDYLRNRFGKDDHFIYIVKKGDTLKAIAKELYHDQNNDILIAFYNDLDINSKLKPDVKLKIPVLKEKHTPQKKMFNIESRLKKARAFLESKQFEMTISVTNEILDYDLLNKEANDLINATYFQWGRKLYHEKKYEKAINELNKADPGYPGVALAIADVENAMQDDGDVQNVLQRAQDSLKAGQFEKALAIAGEIRENDSRRKEAADIINATYFQWGHKLSSEKKYVEAIKRFSKASVDYPGASDAIADLKKIMLKQAQAHYLTGVKYYTDDQLEQAILEWEKTLSLDPNHEKAKKSIADAQKLLNMLKKK